MKPIEFQHRESPHYKVMDNGSERIIYHNRAVTMDIAQFAKTADGKIFILIAERGPESYDYQGLLNMPCGHLDWEETIHEGAVRELYEETGLYQPDLTFYDISSDPANNRQNIQITLVGQLRLLSGESLPDLISTEESRNVRWVDIEALQKEWEEKGEQPDKWAFHHDQKIKEIVGKLFGQ